MALRLFLGEEQAGGLDDVLGANFVPLQVGRVLLGGNADFVAVHDQGMIGVVNSAIEAAVHGVILEHVGHVVGGDQVVDAHDFDVFVIQAGTENQTSNAAETIDTNLNHAKTLL